MNHEKHERKTVYYQFHLFKILWSKLDNITLKRKISIYSAQIIQINAFQQHFRNNTRAFIGLYIQYVIYLFFVCFFMHLFVGVSVCERKKGNWFLFIILLYIANEINLSTKFFLLLVSILQNGNMRDCYLIQINFVQCI